MEKIEIIEDQLMRAKEELVMLRDDKTQIAFDYVEYALILVQELKQEISVLKVCGN